MKKGLISVIIPVYNAETTLIRCIDSVLNQTYQMFELVLIDDGSTDESPAICEKYRAADSRIVYIRKDNGGVSSARNCGIDVANGEYVTFVDSDDWIEDNALENLTNAAFMTGADYVIPRSRGVYYSATGEFEKYVLDDDDFEMKITESDINEEFERLRKTSSFYSTCGRLYKIEFLNKNSIRFDEDIYVLEDFCFNLKCLNKMRLMEHIPQIVYNYSVVGIENYRFKRNYRDYIYSTQHVYEVLKEFLNVRTMPFEKAQYDFIMSYWFFAIEGVVKREKNIVLRIKVLKEISNMVRRARLYDYCTKEVFDTHYRVLFQTRSVILFEAVYILKKVKHILKYKLN